MTEKTQVDDSEKKTQNEDSYEKRYKDSQTHITKLEQENATFRDTSTKDKELFDAVSPFIDWDAVNGTKKTEDTDDSYVDRKTLDGTIKDLREQMNKDRITQSFRIKYPDMVKYEDLVGVYINKTDPRRPAEERIEKAVENVKKLIEAERTKGREDYEIEKKEKAAKEAEVSGLSSAKGPKGEEKEPEGETFKEYIDDRRKALANASGG